MKCYKFIIKGKVQGVFYRKSIQKKAQENGYKGYVKNLTGGDVEAVVLLDDDKLDHFINILKEGSDYSRVDDIAIQKCNEEGFVDFRIRY